MKASRPLLGCWMCSQQPGGKDSQQGEASPPQRQVGEMDFRSSLALRDLSPAGIYGLKNKTWKTNVCQREAAGKNWDYRSSLVCVTLRCLQLILEAPNRSVKIFCWSLVWIFWLDPADLLDHCSPTRHLPGSSSYGGALGQHFYLPKVMSSQLFRQGCSWDLRCP